MAIAQGVTEMTALPVLDTSFFEPGFNQDPFGLFEEIRAKGPVVRNDQRDTWMVTSFRDVSRAVGDLSRYEQPPSTSFENFFGAPTMETVEEPERHQAIRGIWAPDFQPDRLRAERRELIDKVVAERLDPFVERLRSGETLDAVAEMTRSIPTLVIAHMLGIETAMFEQFSDWSDAMGAVPEGHLDPTPRGEEIVQAGRRASAELNVYIGAQVAERRRRASDDLVGKMVGAPYACTHMSEAEVVASNVQLVFAGNETTAKLMAHILVTLARHPDQRRLLAEQRELVPAAVEEAHRYQTITQFIDRRVKAPEVEISGVRLPEGSIVTAMHGAANRDPTRWEDPLRFDIRRPLHGHIGFGFGMHLCLGQNLARLETAVWLNRLLDLLPEYELAQEVDYGRNFQLRGPRSVHLAA